MKRISHHVRRILVLLAALAALCLPAEAALSLPQSFAAAQSGKSGIASPSLTKSKKKNKKKKNSNNSNSNNSNSNNNSNRSNGKESESAGAKVSVQEDGTYTSKEEVAAYLNAFGHLPDNYITKNAAKKLGWISSEGNLDEVAPGKSIGGDYFGNYEEVLPVRKGVDYHECDIDYTGGRRNAKRIIYSTDGYIYYTEDHYTTFEQLYPEE